MNPITELHNKGKGLNCVIIGGGNSVNKFDLDSIPEDYIRFGLNFMWVKTRIDYNIFSDIAYSNFISLYNIKEGIKLIGYEPAIVAEARKKVDYYFDWQSIKSGEHTGFFALQIADSIMNFDNIYLIGFDYYIDNGYIHYYGDNYCKEEKVLRYEKNLISFADEFKKVKWKSNIYNMSQFSTLEIFEQKLKFDSKEAI